MIRYAVFNDAKITRIPLFLAPKLESQTLKLYFWCRLKYNYISILSVKTMSNFRLSKLMVRFLVGGLGRVNCNGLTHEQLTVINK